MSNFEVLALDPATPQIRAPGAGDGYSVPRDITLSNNLIFGGTAQRITGDTSNTTIANRLMFQNSVTNGNTNVSAIPNGTSTISVFRGYGASDPTNAPSISTAQIGTTESRVSSEISGTASYTPLTFYTGGSERMRLDTSGNLGIGTGPLTASTRLSVLGGRTGLVANSEPYSLYVQYGSAKGQYYIGATDSADPALVFSNVSGTERMRIDSSGNVGIGGTAGASRKLELLGTLPGTGTSTRAVSVVMTCPSTSTASSNGFLSTISTAEASFTLDILRCFAAFQGTFGAGSTVTNQYGFYADSNLTGATNNYGFYSNIASGSNRWNFYAAGTADNYFAGNVGIGTASPGKKLHVIATENGILTSASASGTTQIYIAGNNNTAGSGSFDLIQAGDNVAYVFQRANSSLVFGTNNAERMRITAGGEVYIAGTTDQGAYNLQCNGTGVWGAGAYVNGSDERLKDNIQSLDSGLDVIKAMRPVTFQYKPEYSKDQSVQPGFIAQELQQAMAGKPYLKGVVQEGPNHLNVAYQNIIPILVKAIQELEAKVAALEAR